MRERKIQPNVITVFLMFGYTLIYMDKTIIGTSLIPIANNFHLNSTQTGLIVSIFFLGYSIMQVPFGYIADKFGYKPVLMFTLINCAVFTLLFGLAGVFPLFLVIRFMMGIGDAGYPSSSAKSVALNYPIEKRPFAQSLLLATGGIGGILSSVIGVKMISSYGWQSIYYLLSGLFVLALLGITIMLPNKGAMPSAEEKSKVKIKEVLCNRSVWAIFFAMLSYNIVIYSLNTFMPTFLVKTYGVKISQLTPILAAAALLGVAGALLAGKLFGRFVGREKPMLLTIAGLLGLLLVIASVIRSYVTVCVLLSVSIFFCELMFVGLFTWPHKILHKRMIGSSIGVINTGGTLGGFIGPTLFGVIIDHSHGSYVPAFIGMGIFALAAGLLALAVKDQRVSE